MGTPDFSLPSLRTLTKISTVVGVITQPDRPAGRGRSLTEPPVKRAARQLGLNVTQPKSLNDPDVLEKLTAWDADVTVVAAYGQILPESILYAPRAGSVNVHASLLPRWRGAAPVQAAILHGDPTTGITLMKMDAGLDTGPIIVQRELDIHEEETGGELSKRLAALGAEVLADSLTDYLAGTLKPHPQEGSHAAYAPMLRKSDGLLDPQAPAAWLARMVRAYDPWPGTHLFIVGARLAVLEVRPVDHSTGEPPGLIIAQDDFPALTCAEGLLRLALVRPAGKSAMSGAAFLRGNSEIVGKRVNTEVAHKPGA